MFLLRCYFRRTIWQRCVAAAAPKQRPSKRQREPHHRIIVLRHSITARQEPELYMPPRGWWQWSAPRGYGYSRDSSRNGSLSCRSSSTMNMLETRYALQVPSVYHQSLANNDIRKVWDSNQIFSLLIDLYIWDILNRNLLVLRNR